MNTQQNRRRGLAAALGFAALAAALPSVADDYKFIISGYPAVNESYSAESAGTALVTATRCGRSEASALEARYRTRCESEGIGMRTDKRNGLYIIFR